MAKRPVFKVHDFVDIGSGNAGRAHILSMHHEGKSFVAVDKNGFNRRQVETDFRNAGRAVPKNLQMIKRDGLRYLKEQSASSIRILNFDLSGATKKFIAEQGAKSDYLLFNPAFFKEARRVLVPRGRIFILTLGTEADSITASLRQAGFRTKQAVFSDLLNSGQVTSATQTIIRDIIDTHSAHNFVRIDATKK